MPIDIKVNKTDVDKYMSDIDDLFDGISKEFTTSKKIDRLIYKMRKGMRENIMGYHNSRKYQDLKEELKRTGVIQSDSPLYVTGQLIDDLAIQMDLMSDGNIEVSLTFDDVVRERPTYSSMVKVAYDPTAELQYEPMSSKKLASILMDAGRARYPIFDSLYKMYGKDLLREVENVIDDAFKKINKSR